MRSNSNFEGNVMVFLLFFFFSFLRGKGDSSGHAITEEWQVICNLSSRFFWIFIFFRGS
jgi:hypothetical protein